MKKLSIAVTGAAVLATVLAGLSAASPAGATTSGSVTLPASCPPPAPGTVSCLAMFAKPANVAAQAATAAGALPAGYGPADLASAYQIPATTTTATVAIVEAYDNPNVAADMDTYRSTFGLPTCDSDCLHVVDENGGTALPTEQARAWSTESDLAVQMVSATCPTCHITLIEANSAATQDIYTGVRTAASLAQYVVMSWGAPEWSGAPRYTRRYFSTRGVAYVASSGDYGYGTPDYPAASPNVLAVGGTTLTRSTDSGNARGWDETVWNAGDGRSSGTGCSTAARQPAWQAAAVSGVCGDRSDVDVSLVADPDTGVAVYTDPAPGTDAGPTWTVAGGTSVGAPIAAAMYAIAGPPNDYNYPSAYPYYHRSDLTDVVTGNDLFLERGCEPIAQCTARPGYDGPSGLGTPLGVGAFTAVDAAPVTFDQPADVNDDLGDTVQLSVSATTTDTLAQIRYRATGLPPGTTMHPDGSITGSPSQVGTYPVTVTAISSGGPTATATFTWQVGQHSIVAASAPLLVGKPRLGATVRVRLFGWRQDHPTGTVIQPKVHYQWLVNGTPIRNATGASFTIPDRPGWRGRHLRVRVFAQLPEYLPYGYTTGRTAAIRRAS